MASEYGWGPDDITFVLDAYQVCVYMGIDVPEASPTFLPIADYERKYGKLPRQKKKAQKELTGNG